jgi:hypothetical protein
MDDELASRDPAPDRARCDTEHFSDFADGKKLNASGGLATPSGLGDAVFSAASDRGWNSPNHLPRSGELEAVSRLAM